MESSPKKMTGRKRKSKVLPNSRKERKNDREKQRRFEVNQQFDELIHSLNLPPDCKSEKVMILSTAVRTIRGLSAENNNLKIEHSELRLELDKLVSYIQQAFPGQPLPIDLKYRNSSKAGFDSMATPAFGMGPVVAATEKAPRKSSLEVAVAGIVDSIRPTYTHSKSPFAMAAGSTSLDEDFDVFIS